MHHPVLTLLLHCMEFQGDIAGRHIRGTCIILSYPILSYPILSYPILSCPILSYPKLSLSILSYPS
jgi:hypothetical protein